jgi:P4 family phage/plasmid primase-like protien
MTSKFTIYCKQFKTDNVEVANYQFQPGGIDKGWKLSVPDDKKLEFWHNYHELKVKVGEASHLLERPLKEYNVMKIDLDLKHLASAEDLQLTNPAHKYTPEILKEVIELYVQATKKYIILPESCNFTIFEKQHGKLKCKEADSTGYVKDGIHIMCPEIVAPNTILHAIYEAFIKNPALIPVYDKFKNVEPVEVMFDSRVICTNSWFPLGSGKPEDNKDYYKPTTTYKIINKTTSTGESRVLLKPDPLTMEVKDQIIYFSNTGKKVSVKLQDSVNMDALASALSTKLGPKKPGTLTAIDKINLQKQVPSKDMHKKPLDIKYVENLLICLSKSRCSDYDSWFKVGICLYNISPYLITMFDKWSSMVPEKYDQDSVYRYWYENFTKNSDRYSLGLDKLKQYAKEDNEALYYRIVGMHRTKFIDDLINDITTGMHKNKVAHVDLTKKLKEYIELHCEWQVKCADNTSNTWYKFESHRWHEDKGANKIYQMLTDDILKFLRVRWEYFNDKIAKITTEIDRIALETTRPSNPFSQLGVGGGTDSPNPFTGGGPAIDDRLEAHMHQTTNMTLQKQQFVNAIANTVKLSEYIQAPGNRNNIIKDLSQECYDADFYTNLDTNPYVFICNNCVLDMEEGKIRPGLPKDMNTHCSGIDFPYDTNSMEAQEIFGEIEDFLDKIYPDTAIQDYVLNLYAESLCGIVRREEFFIQTGSGSNGKSLMGDFLSRVYGEYYYAPDSTIFNTPKVDPSAPNPIMANVRGKRLVVTTEPKRKKQLQSDIIKQLSGGDTITGRHLNKEPIQFKPTNKWFLQCNDIPEPDAHDDGILRRLCVLPHIAKFVSPDSPKLNNPDKYPHHYPKDPSIKDRLDTWAPYFLAMLWQRYLKLRETNFADLSEDRRPEAVCEATNNYKRESNVYNKFCEDKMEDKIGFRQSLNEIFVTFKNHVRENNSSIKDVDRKDFMTEMSRLVSIRTESKNEWIYDKVIIGQGAEY